MKVGVVGNPRYRDLKAVLEHVAQVAPAKGITLYCEERLGPFWSRRAAGRWSRPSSTRWSPSAATAPSSAAPGC